MKKLYFILAALLLVAPCMGELLLSCEDEGSGVVAINYEMSAGDANLPRGFGLDITVDNGAIITSISNENAGFWIYPGTIDINDGNIVGEGTAVAEVADAPDDTQAGIGTGGITIEMGSLYAAGDPCTPEDAPDNNGILLKVVLDFNGAADCNVVIEENGARGGVVLESTAGADPNISGCVAASVSDCLVVGQVVGGWLITQDMYDVWVAKGKPEEWCYPCHSRGDVDGDDVINTNDLLGTGDKTNGWNYAWSTAWNPGSDTDNDGIINTNDLLGVGDKTNGWKYGWENDCP